MFEILDADASSFTTGEQCALLVATAVERNRFEAAELRLLGDWDARQGWAADGALNGAAWLRNRLGCSTQWARERVRVARRLRHMPLTTTAFEAGDLCFEKVRLLAGLRTGATVEAFDQFEATLVDCARRFDTGELSKVTRYWKAAADAAGFAADAQAQHDGRQAFLSKTLAGMYKLDGSFDPEGGRTVEAELDRIMDDLYRQERRDLEAGLDLTPRTTPQRRADAIVEMARRSAATGGTGTGTGTGVGSGTDSGTGTGSSRGSRPEIGVVLTLETLLGGDTPGRFGDGTPITAETARRLACDAGITRIITGPRSEILDLGRLTPVPSNAQRRAVILRDVGCTFAGCDMPASCCEVHHLIRYNRGSTTGGPTNLAYLALVCPRHHHLVHEGGYTMRRNPHTGHIETFRPDGTPIPTRPRAGPLTPQPGTGQHRVTNPPGPAPGTTRLDLDTRSDGRATVREANRENPDAEAS